MRLPDFLIIGGVRCGTTSLYQQLNRHPSIFMPAVKEPDYFIYQGEVASPDPRIVTTLSEYEGLFREAGADRLVGEASATYLYMAPLTAERIRRQLPSVRLIAQLRHPVDRAFSQFRMARMVGREELDDFREALRREDERIAAGAHVIYHYRHQSFYYESLRRFWRLFGPDSLQVTLFRKFETDPTAVLRKTFGFLGLDTDVPIRRPREASFSTREPRSRIVDRMLNRPGRPGRVARHLVPAKARPRVRQALERQNRRPAPKIDPDLRAQLVDTFRDDVLRVQDLLDEDLEAWLH